MQKLFMCRAAVLLLIFCCVALFSFLSAPPQTSLKVIMERGKKVYTKECLSCHQADGSGVPRLSPPLKKTKWVTGSKEKLIRIVISGFSEQVEIDGEIYYNPMPPHPNMTDQEISDVLTYIRNSFGNKATMITPGDVKYVRNKIKASKK